MQLSVVGLGKLGLCISAVLARAYKVTAIDNNERLITRLNEGVVANKEPRLKDMVRQNRANLKFTTDYTDLGDVTFIVVPTPSDEDGVFDNRYIRQVLNNIEHPHEVVIVSTVMPKTTRQLQEAYSHLNIIYSPTLIALGSVITDFINPDLVLVGTDGTDTTKLLSIYSKLLTTKNICVMSTLEAEIAKLALNCYITTKITFANQIGNICYKLGLKPNLILSAIGRDRRIGTSYFKAGLGYGGPCFPRDNVAMSKFLETINYTDLMFKVVHDLNSLMPFEIVNRIIKLGPEKVGFESLSYKRGTDNGEESQLQDIWNILQGHGIDVCLGKGDVNINWEGICEK